MVAQNRAMLCAANHLEDAAGIHQTYPGTMIALTALRGFGLKIEAALFGFS